jgi:hypothetical protein
VRSFRPDALPGLINASVRWSVMSVVAAMQLKDFIVESGLVVNWRRSGHRPAFSAPPTRKRKTEATRPIATRRSLNQRRLSNRKARNVGFSRFRQRTAPPPVNPHTSPITSKLVRILQMFDLNSRGTAGRARPSACASRSSSTSQSPPTPPPGSTPLFGLVLQLCGRALPVVPFHLQAPAHRYRLWRIA